MFLCRRKLSNVSGLPYQLIKYSFLFRVETLGHFYLKTFEVVQTPNFGGNNTSQFASFTEQDTLPEI